MLRKISIKGNADSHKSAAKKFFGEKIEIISCTSAVELFKVTESDYNIHAAILPIENSKNGPLLANYRLLHKSLLKVTGEVYTGKENDYTRFFVLQRNSDKDNATINKASLFFETDHYSGSLSRVLSIIARAGINISMIQSSVVPGREWACGVYTDVELESPDDLKDAVKRMENAAEKFYIFGVYKKGLVPL